MDEQTIRVLRKLHIDAFDEREETRRWIIEIGNALPNGFVLPYTVDGQSIHEHWRRTKDAIISELRKIEHPSP